MESGSPKENLMKKLFSLVSVLTVSFLIPSVPATSQSQALPEPETIGAFYFLDSSKNTLTRLDKQIATSRKRGMVKEEVLVEITGEKASLRLKSGEGIEFVSSLPNGIDPNKYQLISLTVRKGKREAVLAQSTFAGNKSNPVFLPYNVTKYGNAYKFTPSSALPPGEYAFSPNDSYDVFCFGVEAPNGAKTN